jgi:hypothetical protein
MFLNETLVINKNDMIITCGGSKESKLLNKIFEGNAQAQFLIMRQQFEEGALNSPTLELSRHNLILFSRILGPCIEVAMLTAIRYEFPFQPCHKYTCAM